MGVVYSLPLCSRGDSGAKDTNQPEPGADQNNNQPMPTLQEAPENQIDKSPVVVDEQPLSAARLTSIENVNVEGNVIEIEESGANNPPEATSTPKLERSHSESDIDEPIMDDDYYGVMSTSDSGLDNSSSEELEQLSLGPSAMASPRLPPGVARQELEDRPYSAAKNRIDNDEGITEGDTVISITLDNHETCEEDEEDEDEVEDPVERPPEPTVPDERVSSSSSSDNNSSDEPDNRSPVDQIANHKTGGDTVNAISSLLSEIVGSDKPYDHNSSHSLTR